MEEQNHNGAQNFEPIPGLDVQTRVFVRKMGAGYTEITGVKSFERSDDDVSGGEITVVMAEGQDAALKSLLLNANDKYVDVKIEFSIGMVMTFSGYVEDISSDTICFAVATPITTDVMDISDSALH
jgi:hypothetical protein